MIVVVGAGAAGLAVARQLQRRSLHAVVLDEGSSGHVWTSHYDSLRLHTPKGASGLPDRPMPHHYATFPAAHAVRDYLEGYRRRFALEVHEGVGVTHAGWDGLGWTLATSAGETHADVLVAATGVASAPVWSPIEGLDRFEGTVLHSCQYQNPVPFLGQEVLVVGAGNSGCEIAVELARAGVTVSISVRGGAVFVPRTRSAIALQMGAFLMRNLPRPAANHLYEWFSTDFPELGLPQPPGPRIEHYPVVGFELPHAVRDRTVSTVGEVDRFDGDAAKFRDGRRRRFDTVILATGFRPALDWLDGSQLSLGDSGTPRVDRYWRSVLNPRLSLVGYVYPPTEGWLQGIARVARGAARGIDLTVRDAP